MYDAVRFVVFLLFSDCLGCPSEMADETSIVLWRAGERCERFSFMVIRLNAGIEDESPRFPVPPLGVIKSYGVDAS